MRTKAGRRFMSFLVGITIGFVAIPGGCGGTQEGTSAAFSPEADKPRQDAMRDYMMKKKSGQPGAGKNAK